MAFFSLCSNMLKVLSFLCFLVIAQENTVQLKNGARIGFLSMFPENSGIFYDNRALWVKTKGLFSRELKSIFPEKDVHFHINVNEEITNVLKEGLATQYACVSLISPTPIEKYLTGYAIEGWWGPETKSVDIKETQFLLKKHNLHHIIAIVPVTYYLPPLGGEATGLNLSFIGDRLYFSAVYAILIFSKSQKTYRSLKQVYFASEKDVFSFNKKTYNQQHVNLYYEIFQKKFLRHIHEQVKKLLAGQPPAHVFKRPKKPFYYNLPH